MEHNDKLQVNATPRHVSEVRTFSTDEGPDPKLVEVFERLTEWQRELGRCLQRARSQRDLPVYSDPELLVRINDWAAPLWVVPIWGLRYCFTKAIACRVQGTFTFEAGEVVRIWKEMAQSTRDHLFRVFSQGKVIAGPACEWCNGTGFVYVDKAGHRFKWEQREQGEAMKRCAHTDVAGQMEL